MFFLHACGPRSSADFLFGDAEGASSTGESGVGASAAASSGSVGAGAAAGIPDVDAGASGSSASAPGCDASSGCSDAEPPPCDAGSNTCASCTADVDCGETGFCANAICSPRVCEPGVVACRDNAIATCNSRGSGYDVSRTCPEGSQCSVDASRNECLAMDDAGGCEAPIVWLLVDRSTSMFEDEIGEQTAWEAVVEALVGDGGAVTELAGQVRFALTTFSGDQEQTCPELSTLEPALNQAEALREALAAVTPPTDDEKLETPTSAAFAAVTQMLGELDAEAPRYILLISDATPDFCDDSLVDCARDAVIAAVQRAASDGVTTLVAGVESEATESGQGPYFQALANAGQGLPVEPDDEIEDNCEPVRGRYVRGNDNASYVTSSEAFADGIMQAIQGTLCE